MNRPPLDQEAAQRYAWFCRVGWACPVLNDPRVIHGTATPLDIDRLIQEGMHRWPSRPPVPLINPPETPEPEAA